MRRLAQALALVVVLYALQALYSSDVEHAVKTLGFFYVPFAVTFRLLLEVRWSRRLLLQAFGRDRGRWRCCSPPSGSSSGRRAGC